MKSRYLIFFLIFLFLAALFTLLRNPISDAVNTILIAVGEGRSIRVDNTDMVQRKTEKNVKVKGGARIAVAAQVRILPGKLSVPPVNLLKEGKAGRKRALLFPAQWAVLGCFELSAIGRKLDLKTALEQECMNPEADGVSFQMVPKGFEWKHLQSMSTDGRVNLSETFRKNNKQAAAWMVTEIEVEKDYPDARMLVGILPFGRVFLNGREVFVSTPKTPARADGVNIPVSLKKGRNRIVVKTATANPRSWAVFVRFTTAKKVPLMLVAEPVKKAAPPAAK
ncbi:MAG: hypothetical protein J5806_04690 [Lentisphaeria bacterium]|nr:hypothetical protein [Lentisphaeria bacterium]